MGYLSAIKTAFFSFPIIAFLFTIPFVLHQYHKYGSINKLRVLIIYSFILYMMTIYFLTILPLPKMSEIDMSAPSVQLVPFQFVTDFINHTSLDITDPSTYIKALTEPYFYTVIFNLFMTVPFGMYLRYYFKCSLKKTILFSFLLSLFFEVTQLTGLYFIYPHSYRLFDVDDLIVNTLGGVLGYLLIGVIMKHLPSRDEIDQKALENGEVVSGFRRFTLFFLDMFVYIIFLGIFEMFFDIPFTVYITLFIYYVFVPFIWNGRTLASKFLNVRLEFDNKKFIKLILRMLFIWFYYFALPVITFMGIIYLTQILDLTNAEIAILYVSAIVIVLMFYLVNIVFLFKNHFMFYDKMFHVKYISTISERKKPSN